MDSKIIFQQPVSRGRGNFPMIFSAMILSGLFYYELRITDYEV